MGYRGQGVSGTWIWLHGGLGMAAPQSCMADPPDLVLLIFRADETWTRVISGVRRELSQACRCVGVIVGEHSPDMCRILPNGQWVGSRPGPDPATRRCNL
jgi:hypothetical protein